LVKKRQWRSVVNVLLRLERNGLEVEYEWSMRSSRVVAG
jgi:hypothetical protein